jgi:disulfide bond formation protein DsbB
MARHRILLVVLLGAAGVVGGALLFQYVGGLAPCELCLYERWPYYAAIPLAAATATPRAAPGDARAAALLLVLLFAASTVLAFYHVGVEQHWFAGPTACTGAGGTAKTIDELRAQLMAQQPVQCDQPQFSLLGTTLAQWNLAASLALAGLAGWAWRRG